MEDSSMMARRAAVAEMIRAGEPNNPIMERARNASHLSDGILHGWLGLTKTMCVGDRDQLDPEDDLDDPQCGIHRYVHSDGLLINSSVMGWELTNNSIALR
jgi:hypothetical protein